MSEIEALGNSYIGRETLGKSAYPGRIILQPKPAVLSTRSVSTPINLHDKRTQHLEVEEKQKRVESVSEDLADVLLRICLQLDAIMERRANFYGGIFHMPPLFSELKMLKARVSLCLDYLSSGCRHSKPFKRSSVISGGRNAPILDDDSIKEDFSAMQVLHDPFFQLTPTIKDVVGRVFWQDMSSRGQSHGTFKYVTWKQFADAFERVYGQQPRSVMDRFQTALMQMEEDISALDLDEIDYCNESYEKSGEDMISTTRSGDYFTLNGLRKFCMYGNNNNSNSPSRKKRKSHVPKWIRKSIPCQIGDGQLDEDVCECCPKNTPQMEVEMEACFREYTNYSCNIRPSSFVVSMNIFSKFCTDFGGLFEGFIKVTDPGTHIECLGSVEDLSKEELYNLGMVEDSDVGDSSSNEVPENSVLLKPTIIKDLLGLKILQLSCGGQHAAVLLEGGEVFTWGKGGFGRLGHGDSKPSTSPRPVPISHHCVQVACGFAYTAVVTSCGQAYAWGAGENGRLGVGDEQDRNKPTRMLIRSKVRVKSVCAGSVHTCVLSSEGEVYSFGKHEYTGHGSSSDILVPRKLDAFEDNVAQLSVGPGGYHTIALTAETGKVFTWGHNRVGQLGFPISDQNAASGDGGYFVPKPTWVTAISNLKVAMVVAGWGHSAVVTDKGEVYTCGRNFQGQLGLGEPDFSTVNERGHPYQSRFRKVQGELSDARISQFACGGEHSIALSTSGQLYAFGKGHKGQLGLQTCETRYVPTRIRRFEEDRRQTLQVACGNNCTLVLRGRYQVPSLFDLCHQKVREERRKGGSPLPTLINSILSLQEDGITENL